MVRVRLPEGGLRRHRVFRMTALYIIAGWVVIQVASEALPALSLENAIQWMGQVAEIRMPWYPWLVGWFPQFRNLHEHPLVREKAHELGVPLLGGPT